MTSAQIREKLEKVSRVLAETPDRARVKNAPATATLLESLKCQVTGQAGEMLQTDMPMGVGGGATAPNPGWLMRAALASCNATCIAMRAATLGVTLTKLDVTVSSESDNRGMLGLDESVSAGLQDLRIQVRIGAPGASAEQLGELVRWACSHSPVGSTNVPSAQVEIQVE